MIFADERLVCYPRCNEDKKKSVSKDKVTEANDTSSLWKVQQKKKDNKSSVVLKKIKRKLSAAESNIKEVILKGEVQKHISKISLEKVKKDLMEAKQKSRQDMITLKRHSYDRVSAMNDTLSASTLKACISLKTWKVKLDNEKKKSKIGLTQCEEETFILQRESKEQKAKADASAKNIRKEVREFKSEKHYQIVALKETVRDNKTLLNLQIQARRQQNKEFAETTRKAKGKATQDLKLALEEPRKLRGDLRELNNVLKHVERKQRCLIKIKN